MAHRSGSFGFAMHGPTSAIHPARGPDDVLIDDVDAGAHDADAGALASNARSREVDAGTHAATGNAHDAGAPRMKWMAGRKLGTAARMR